MRRTIGTILLVAGAVGCAGAPPVAPQRFTDAESEIRAAEAIGAANNPQGKLHLQNARDQVEAARKLSKDKPEEAARKLELAQSEAELANAMTRELSARSEADQAKQRLDQVKAGTGGSR